MLIDQLGMEHLNSRLSSQKNVLTEIDFGKPAFSQDSDEAVVAKLLSNTVRAISHLCFLCLCSPLNVIQTPSKYVQIINNKCTYVN
jgi:hypothetical protein